MARIRKINSLIDAATRRSAAKLIVEAQEMLVGYTPNYMSGSSPVGHLEFRSLHQPPRRIPPSVKQATAATSRRCPALRPRPARRNTRGLWHFCRA
jgi:hypothetical protein